MRDRALITTGLMTFLALATFPVWYNMASGGRAGAPVLARPSDAAIQRVRGTRACVAPRDFMRTSHMQLLATWREDVVRRNAREFVAYDAHRYEKNLTATCLGCHGDKAQFCDRCHDYAGVSPGCADCHRKS
jgi:hypothetical protein